ncbi:hypothetical protein [Massilia sp. S19_KUP03_FR1]|uniref:hypothetical protein n=1 Tax=Massilia sp. S19_KUP03_FR1 TaxID=3025503 RepID=UPI002FCDD0BA
MPIEYHSAEEIYLSFKAACATCNRLLAESDKYSPTANSPELQVLVSRFMGSAYLGVMRPIENNFPDLMARSIGNVAVTQNNLEGVLADFYTQFFTVAKLAVSKNSETITAAEKNGFFRQGTLDDINKAMMEIDKFAYKQ